MSLRSSWPHHPRQHAVHSAHPSATPYTQHLPSRDRQGAAVAGIGSASSTEQEVAVLPPPNSPSGTPRPSVRSAAQPIKQAFPPTTPHPLPHKARPSLSRYLLTACAFLAALPAHAETGSRACAPCHAEIYKKYMPTGMARSSGRVPATTNKESFERAVFTAESNGASFKISPTFRLDFSRDTAKATRQLTWFIGSGRLGRSYLFEKDAMLFQAPVSYFAKSKTWNVSPGYESKPTADFTRQIETSCLQCHASRIQSTSPIKFASPKPFLEDGVSCERCHGDGAAHIAGKARMVNPAKLPAEARDMQGR